jgi:hypothetical protein
MFWGCVSVFGAGSLVPIDGSVDSTKYIHILQTHLLPIAKAWYGDEDWILIQDNAPCHVSVMTRQFLYQKGIHVMPWPSNSPDMNVIENMWQMLKYKLYREGSGKSRHDVISKVMNIWNNDDDLRDACISAVSTMQKRVKSLYNSHGGITKY